MADVNKIMIRIAKQTAKLYDKKFRKAIYNQNLCLLAAFDDFCVETGITNRQEEKILNRILLDVLFLDERDLEDAIERYQWCFER